MHNRLQGLTSLSWWLCTFIVPVCLGNYRYGGGGFFVPAPIGCIGLRDICAQEGQAETGQHADERGIDIGPLERTALQQPVP